MPGVKAILTADDIPPTADTLTDNGTVIKASKWGERALTNEPIYQGEPILAVAAVDELTAAEAIEKIRLIFEPLPFVIDPLESLRPGGPNAREDGNVWFRPEPPQSSSACAPGAQVDGGGFCRVQRRPTADGPRTRPLVLWRRRSGFQERRAGS